MAKKRYDLVGNIMAYESGEYDESTPRGAMKTLTLFSKLIKSGQAWSLQGHYGRTAKALIEDGFIDRKGKINRKKLESMGVD